MIETRTIDRNRNRNRNFDSAGGDRGCKVMDSRSGGLHETEGGVGRDWCCAN